MHHARWMAVILYSAKMFLLSDQIGYEPEYVLKLEKFLTFTSIVYVQVWFQASVSVDAVNNDLMLWKDIKTYNDKEISEAALTILERHFWYMTEELSTFGFFSNKISAEEKNCMAKQLIKYPRKCNILKGIPQFPIVTMNTKPSHLIGSKSWTLFNLIGHKADWLKNPQSEWPKDKEYVEAYDLLTNLKVVNDPAERAIKLITDYAVALTNNEEEKQCLLQVVESHRKLLPNIKKEELKNI